MIKIIIADDHPIIRSGLKQVIETTADIMVVGVAADGHEVLERIRGSDADLLLLDMTMPGLSGVDLIQHICVETPSLPILVLSMHNEVQIASRALRAGACGYLTKDSDPEVLLAAIRKVARGGKTIDPLLADAMIFEVWNSDALPRDVLSEREFQVLKLLALGQSINEVGLSLNLSAKTISTNKARLMKKLGLANNAELFSYAIKHGLAKQ